jgi:hypothetical protein
VGDVHQLLPVLGVQASQRTAPGPRVVHLDEREALANGGLEILESECLAEEASLVAERLVRVDPDAGQPTLVESFDKLRMSGLAHAASVSKDKRDDPQ